MRDKAKGAQRPELHRDWIDADAIEIVDRLQRAGFDTYLVGGCVRDLLAGIHPKDFDIATTAHPEKVKKVIRNSYLIGRRFRLVLVKRDQRQYEVATFRRDPRPDELNNEEVSPDNLYGSEEEDAKRRDFTLNALFYDPIKNKVIDYCGGLKDIEDRVIRVIGDPEKRIKEDPIRILRAVRLSHKLKFVLTPDLRSAISQNGKEIVRSVLPRKREEILKILRLQDPAICFHELYDLNVLQHLSPTLSEIYEHPDKLSEFDFYLHRLHDLVTDVESPGELFGGLLLAYYRTMVAPDPDDGPNPNQMLDDPKIKLFFRDELGMSNFEQRLFSKAMSMQILLRNVQKFKQRGERRQFSVVSNESFKLALNIARIDHLLSGSDYLFWLSTYEKALPGILESQSERKRRPVRRRRRPRKNPAAQ